MLAIAEGQFVPAAKVENVRDVEVAKTIIALNPEARDVRRAISDGPTVEKVTGIAPAFGPRVSPKEIQSIRIMLLKGGLKAVVIAVAFGRGVASPRSEIGEGDDVVGRERADVHARIQDL